MGIPGLVGRYFNKNVRGIIEFIKLFNVGSVSIDFNALIHNVASKFFGYGEYLSKFKLSEQDTERKRKRIISERTSYTGEELEKMLFDKIWEKIVKIVEYFSPRKYLLICTDGVPVMGKICQQRQRRFKSHPKDLFDSNSITTGTEFMIRLDTFLRNKIEKNMVLLPPNVIYSSHLVPGEGEHKMMNLMKEHLTNIEGYHVIHGLDADLVMLSLVSPVKNILLSRYDDTHKYRDKPNYPRNKDERRNYKKHMKKEVIKINDLKNWLAGNFMPDTVIYDFILLSFFIGNDFVPPIASLIEMENTPDYNSFQYILEKYKEYGLGLTKWENDSYVIDEVNLRDFLSILLVDEPERLAASAGVKANYPMKQLNDAIIDGAFYYENFIENWYQSELDPVEGFNIEAILKYSTPGVATPFDKLSGEEELDPGVNDFRKLKMAEKYIITLKWILRYYQLGHFSVNFEHFYPHFHAPLLTEIVDILNYDTDKGYKFDKSVLPFSSLHQLLSVMPYHSIDVIPNELKDLYSYNSIIEHYHPVEFETEVFGSDKHKSIVKIPWIDPNMIRAAMKMCVFTEKRIVNWAEAENIHYERKETEHELKVEMKNTMRPGDIKLSDPWFTEILRGRKTVEGMIKKGKIANVKPGDTIVFFNPDKNERMSVTVSNVREYASIEDFVNGEELKKIAPHLNSEQSAIDIYEHLNEDYISRNDKYTFLAIEMKNSILETGKIKIRNEYSSRGRGGFPGRGRGFSGERERQPFRERTYTRKPQSEESSTERSYTERRPRTESPTSGSEESQPRKFTYLGEFSSRGSSRGSRGSRGGSRGSSRGSRGVPRSNVWG